MWTSVFRQCSGFRRAENGGSQALANNAFAWEWHVIFTCMSLAKLRDLAGPTQMREEGLVSSVKSIESSTNSEAKELIWWLIVLYYLQPSSII